MHLQKTSQSMQINSDAAYQKFNLLNAEHFVSSLEMWNNERLIRRAAIASSTRFPSFITAQVETVVPRTVDKILTSTVDHYGRILVGTKCGKILQVDESNRARQLFSLEGRPVVRLESVKNFVLACDGKSRHIWLADGPLESAIKYPISEEATLVLAAALDHKGPGKGYFIDGNRNLWYGSPAERLPMSKVAVLLHQNTFIHQMQRTSYLIVAGKKRATLLMGEHCQPIEPACIPYSDDFRSFASSADSGLFSLSAGSVAYLFDIRTATRRPVVCFSVGKGGREEIRSSIFVGEHSFCIGGDSGSLEVYDLRSNYIKYSNNLERGCLFSTLFDPSTARLHLSGGSAYTNQRDPFHFTLF